MKIFNMNLGPQKKKKNLCLGITEMTNKKNKKTIPPGSSVTKGNFFLSSRQFPTCPLTI